MRHAVALLPLVAIIGCTMATAADAGGSDAACPEAPAPLVCIADGSGCPLLSIAGEAPTGPGRIAGSLDPAIRADPLFPHRLWLAYSVSAIGTLPDPDGGQMVPVYGIGTHLARSDDDGQSWTFVTALWPPTETPYPVDGGPLGFINSETPSLFAVSDGGSVTWYGARLRYFQQPILGYNPDFLHSWTIVIAAAATTDLANPAQPTDLGNAPQTVLGMTSTASGWNADVRLDQLAAGALSDCSIWNNPAIFAQAGKLYLITECVPFGNENGRVIVFSTVPDGIPSSWSWTYLGVLADHATAAELGADALLMPEVDVAEDGTTLLALLSPARRHPSGTLVSYACLALELASIDPPLFRAGCDGGLVTRMDLEAGPDLADGGKLGACSYDARSATGVLMFTQTQNFALRSSSARP
jgi:hypothetical protein